MNNIVYDFVYNGIKLSDFGSIVSVFNGSTGITQSQGVNISFQTVKTRQSQRMQKIGISYDEVLTTIISISKNNCESGNIREYTQEEIRAIMRWLNDEIYHDLQFVSDLYEDVYFKAYANVSKINVNNKCIGFEITFICDSSFGYTDKYFNNELSEENHIFKFPVDNDRQSFVYPIIKITLKSNGDLEILSNTEEYRKFILRDCSIDEVIEIDCEKRTIKSSDKSHNLPHSFNFIFPRINYNYEENFYELSFSLDCFVELKITEVRKIGVI